MIVDLLLEQLESFCQLKEPAQHNKGATQTFLLPDAQWEL